VQGAWNGGGDRTGSIPRTLAAGVVAHNEEAHLRSAVVSLIEQELPPGVKWGDIWVVASGCTDRTVEVAQDLTAQDPRVRVIVEKERGGKARALRQVFDRATGDALVLLNADARAEPGAVEQLVLASQGKTAPFAVMARPVVPHQTAGRWAPTFRWMWELHHEFHAQLLAQGQGGHLSDELLLVSLPSVPPIPEGIINDGSYLAVWLSQHAGGRWYAPGARVSIQVPDNVRDHLGQRRRIHVGNIQVASVLGTAPASIPRHFLAQPADTLRLLRRTLRSPGGIGHLARLASWELAAHGLAVWDRLPPRKDHVRWHRIRPTVENGRATPRTPTVAPDPPPAFVPAPVEDRAAGLVRLASRFGASLSLSEMVRLLPDDGPRTIRDAQAWLQEHPQVGRLDGHEVVAPGSDGAPTLLRRERGRVYAEQARRLWDGALAPARSWVRCVAVTGSTAYGQPEEGDDVDFLLVTQRGALWWTLAYVLLAVRFHRSRRRGAGEPPPCFNYAVDERAAEREYTSNRGLLFAREALTAKPIWGEAYYRGLLGRSEWMASEMPRLYRERAGLPGRTERSSAPRLVRVLNLALYPLLASYLQLVSLYRNAGLRRRGAEESLFRTETGPTKMAYHSRRYDLLEVAYSTENATSIREPELRGSRQGAPTR